MKLRKETRNGNLPVPVLFLFCDSRSWRSRQPASQARKRGLDHHMSQAAAFWNGDAALGKILYGKHY